MTSTLVKCVLECGRHKKSKNELVLQICDFFFFKASTANYALVTYTNMVG